MILSRVWLHIQIRIRPIQIDNDIIRTQEYDTIHRKIRKNLSNRLNHLQNSTLPCLNEMPPHFIHEIKTKGYDVIEFPAQ